MPYYDYRCPCGWEAELKKRMDERVVVCPGCKKEVPPAFTTAPVSIWNTMGSTRVGKK